MTDPLDSTTPMVRSSTHRAFRAMSALFAATTVFVLVLFVYELERRHEIRSGLFTYAVFTGATAVGLWLVRKWGRSLALVMALGNIGLGTLSVLSVIMSKHGPLLGPALLLVLSLALAFVLGRRVFNLPDGQG